MILATIALSMKVQQVEVDEQGEQRDVRLKLSSGYESLDNAAMKAVKMWKFKPGTLDGFPVKSTVEVPIHFQLERH